MPKGRSNARARSHKTPHYPHYHIFRGYRTDTGPRCCPLQMYSETHNRGGSSWQVQVDAKHTQPRRKTRSISQTKPALMCFHSLSHVAAAAHTDQEVTGRLSWHSMTDSPGQSASLFRIACLDAPKAPRPAKTMRSGAKGKPALCHRYAHISLCTCLLSHTNPR